MLNAKAAYMFMLLRHLSI